MVVIDGRAPNFALLNASWYISLDEQRQKLLDDRYIGSYLTEGMFPSVKGNPSLRRGEVAMYDVRLPGDGVRSSFDVTISAFYGGQTPGMRSISTDLQPGVSLIAINMNTYARAANYAQAQAWAEEDEVRLAGREVVGASWFFNNLMSPSAEPGGFSFWLGDLVSTEPKTEGRVVSYNRSRFKGTFFALSERINRPHLWPTVRRLA